MKKLRLGKMLLILSVSICVVLLLSFTYSLFFATREKVNFFNPPMNLGTVKTIVPSGDGGYYVGANNYGVVKLTANGNVDPTFQPPPMVSPAESIVVNKDKTVVAVGRIHFLTKEINLGNYEDDPKPINIVKFLPDGQLDKTFTAPQIGKAEIIFVTSDGKYVVGGNKNIDNNKSTYSSEMTYSRQAEATPNVDGYPYLIRLNKNGSKDTSWATHSDFQGTITSGVRNKDDSYIVAGLFRPPIDTRNEIEQNKVRKVTPATPENPTTMVLKFNSNGEFDQNFVLPTNTIPIEGAYSISTLPDGGYLVGGAFRVPSWGITPTNIIKLEEDGIINTNFPEKPKTISDQIASPIYSIYVTKNTYTLGGRGTLTQLNYLGKNVTGKNLPTLADESSIYSIVERTNNIFLFGGSFYNSDKNILEEKE